MAKRTERHVRKTKAALATPAARPVTDRVLELGGSGNYGLVPSGVPSALGGVTTPDKSGAIGTPGNLNVFGFLTGEDYNPDLDGYPMFGNYNKMRLSDAQVNATLLMLKLPLKGATWMVKPGSDNPQDMAIADFVQANLIDDDALQRSWQHVLDNAMLKFDFGCSAEEIVWGVRDESWNAGASPKSVSAAARVIEMAKHGNPWALKTIERGGDAMYSTVIDLAPRLPRTFYRWIEKDGTLDTLQQFAPKNGQYGYYNIPAKQLTLHVRGREGNNYYGRSVLRPAYPHWWWKSQLYRIDMIGHDRFHVGIPRAALDENYDAETASLSKIEATLKGLRSHDRAYMVQPYGVTYDVYGARESGSGTSGILLSIEHHNQMIARNILQGFAAQGEQRHGSFGAAKVLSDAFFDAIEGEANEICSEIKQCVVKPLCDANFNMRGRKYPTIACVDLNIVDTNQLATAIAALTDKNVITPDDDLEAWLRDLFDAPPLPEDLQGRDRTKPAPTPMVAAPVAPTKTDDPIDPKKNKEKEAVEAARRTPYREKGRTFSRRPTMFERQVFDLHGIPATLDAAQEKLLAEMTSIRRTQLAAVAAKIAKKDGRKTPAFTDIRHEHITMPGIPDMVKAIRAAQTAALDYGRQTVQDEVERQGSKAGKAISASGPAASGRKTTTSSLVSSARITARKQAEAWRGRILETGLRLRRNGLQGKELEARIEQELEDEIESGAKRDAASEINEAFGLGRAGAARELGTAVEMATYSALLDANTCEVCADLDGEEFTVDTPEYDAVLPPNPRCEGGDACRCVMIYVSKDDNEEE